MDWSPLEEDDPLDPGVTVGTLVPVEAAGGAGVVLGGVAELMDPLPADPATVAAAPLTSIKSGILESSAGAALAICINTISIRGRAAMFRLQ